jgi:small subunit ribosomal protein S20
VKPLQTAVNEPKEKNMPRRRTSLKKTRQDKKRHLRNLKIKQQLKKTIKKFQALLSAKNIDEAKALIGKVFSQLDKAAKKRIIHPNAADRKKSRLMKALGKHT